MTDMDLIKRAQELGERCQRRNMLTRTGFLSPAEQAELQRWAKHKTAFQILFEGGCESSERKIAFFLPPLMDAEDFQVQEHIFAIKAAAGFGEPAHRDYMGAILGLGISREGVGDIRVMKCCAYVFCLEPVQKLLLEELNQVGRYAIKVTEISQAEIPAPERSVQPVTFTVKSLRLDAVASGLFSLSRTTAAEEIRLGLLFHNYEQCLRPDATVAQGDVLSIKGRGKGLIAQIGGESKKGRIFVQGERYV